MDLPVVDSAGGSLVSWAPVDGSRGVPTPSAPPLARSLVALVCGGDVLMGFHVLRRQWELPGGALEPGESAYDAAVRELAEETGIRAESLTPVGHAEFVYGGEASRHLAAVFTGTVDTRPSTEVNAEMSGFRWWRVGATVWEGLSPIDAEVARRAVAANG